MLPRVATLERCAAELAAFEAEALAAELGPEQNEPKTPRSSAVDGCLAARLSDLCSRRGTSPSMNASTAPMFVESARAWHALEADQVLADLGSSAGGLSSDEVARRLGSHGANEYGTGKRESLIGELAEALFEPLQLLLVAVGVLSLIFGELRDAVAIFAIIAAVAAIETVTELRARRALDTLKLLAAPQARVVRDGQSLLIAARELVPGDIIVLQTGDLVPADGRVLAADSLATDESALTGEAEPASKGASAVAEGADLAERSSLLFAGTPVVSGEGRAVVVATGTATEVGQLGRMVAEEEEPATPLQRSMAELARVILVVAVAASVLVPAVGFLRGQPFTTMLLAGLTIAFATIPEELPILVSVLLAVGGRRLARRGALLRRLRAGETIGAVTVVVTDKTGTLTENELRLERLEGPNGRLLQLAAATQTRERGGKLANPLERALEEAASDVTVAGELVASFPFDPTRKRMSRVWREGDEVTVYAKGAPEAIVERCILTQDERERALVAVDKLAEAGLRVIAFADARRAAVPADADAAEVDLTLVGFAAFDDPLRAGVPEAVAALHGAGVATIVVTGDHPRTAAAVARRAGLGGGKALIGGAQLATIADDELSRHLTDGAVVARATPADKLRIVRLLQARGEIVAVTGDGANDAPALAGANVGIAMGKRGTDLAREAADLVLTDDAYPTIAAAVESGRTIASQLRRAVAFYLGAKVALVATILVPLALGMRAPFTPVQIVILELFMDLGASVAFVSEPTASEAMRQPPRDPGRRFLDRAELSAIALAGFALLVGVLAAFFLVRARYGADYGGVAAFAAWLVGHAAVAWGLRARPRLPLTANVAFPVWAAAAALTGVLLTSVFAPPLGLAALPAAGWALVMAAAAGSAVLVAIGRRTLRISERL